MSAIAGIQTAIQVGGRQVARQAAANIGTSAAINTAVGTGATAGTYALSALKPMLIGDTAVLTGQAADAVGSIAAKELLPSFITSTVGGSLKAIDAAIGAGILTAGVAANNLFALATGKGAVSMAYSGAKSGIGMIGNAFKSSANYIGGFFAKKAAPQAAANTFLRAA